MKITNFKIAENVLKYPESLKHLAPLIPSYTCSFNIKNINCTVSNALIRSMGGELPVKYLDIVYEDIITDDNYVMREALIRRIRAIPIKQNIKIGTVFKLSYTNNTPSLVTVKTSELKSIDNISLPFQQNITLWGLFPDKSLKLKVVVMQTYPYIEGYGCLSLISQAVALPIDIELFDVYTGGTPTSLSNAADFMVRFKTHGTMEPINILKMACNDLIARVRRVEEFIPIKIIDNNVSEYRIIGESDTISKLFLKTIIEQFDTVSSVTEFITSNTVYLRLCIMDESIDADDVVRRAIDIICSTFESMIELF